MTGFCSRRPGTIGVGDHPPRPLTRSSALGAWFGRAGASPRALPLSAGRSAELESALHSASAAARDYCSMTSRLVSQGQTPWARIHHDASRHGVGTSPEGGGRFGAKFTKIRLFGAVHHVFFCTYFRFVEDAPLVKDYLKNIDAVPRNTRATFSSLRA